MLTIGQAAKATGITAKMIRYYEAIGLLKSAHRTQSGYRVYSPQDLHTLRFIQQARGLGFSMAHIASLLELWQNQQRSSAQVKELAQVHLQHVNKRIQELSSIQQALQDLVSHCYGDERPDCPILEKLGTDNAVSAVHNQHNLKHSL